MEQKILISERDSQIVIEKKFDIKKGDKVEVFYLKNEQEEIVSARVELNGESMGKFDLEELEEFLSLFLSEPI